MVEQCIHEGAVPVSGCRMDDEPCRLVDDKQMLVLEDYPKRDVLRFVMRGLRFRNCELKPLTASHLGCGIPERLPAHDKRPTSDECLEPFSRKGRNCGGQCAIESPAFAGGLQAYIDDLVAPHIIDMG